MEDYVTHKEMVIAVVALWCTIAGYGNRNHWSGSLCSTVGLVAYIMFLFWRW